MLTEAEETWLAVKACDGLMVLSAVLLLFVEPLGWLV